MDTLNALDELYAEVEAQSFDKLPAGTYTGVVKKVTFKGDNTWKDGTKVPQVSFQLSVTEGECKGTSEFVNLNLGGKQPEHIRISLSIFKGLMSKFGIKADSIGDVLDEIEETIGREVKFKVEPQKNNPEYTNVTILDVL